MKSGKYRAIRQLCKYFIFYSNISDFIVENLEKIAFKG